MESTTTLSKLKSGRRISVLPDEAASTIIIQSGSPERLFAATTDKTTSNKYASDIYSQRLKDAFALASASDDAPPWDFS